MTAPALSLRTPIRAAYYNTPILEPARLRASRNLGSYTKLYHRYIVPYGQWWKREAIKEPDVVIPGAKHKRATLTKPV